MEPHEPLVKPKDTQSHDKFQTQLQPKRIQHLSFDHYHAYWKGLATSQASTSTSNESHQKKASKARLEEMASRYTINYLWFLFGKMNRERQLIYGRFPNQIKDDKVNDKRQTHVQNMRKLYNIENTEPIKNEPPLPTKGDIPKDEWEHEADDLVEWTKTLIY